MPEKYYITTSIPYVNAAPHIGFAMEAIQADFLARYNKMFGKDVFFLTGTDEHGNKLYQTAKEQNKTAQELADENAIHFEKLTKVLNLSNNDFIRTTSDRHKRGAEKLWMKIFEKGDLYKDKYKGFYCIGCEAYVTEKDLVDGLCPIHKKEPIKIEEENYFFKLSKYSEEIGKKIESNEIKVLPEAKKHEILNVIKSGLKDVSFSRPKKSLTWGITVPNDESQVMYVWCDALSNYITALDFENEGEKFKKYWPSDCHLIGKDILRFHAGIWIGMLLSAGLSLPKRIFVHGFITSEGQKMSKSLGNVVDPFEIVDVYGCDAVRYYLLNEIPTTDDGDFSKERFKSVYDAHLRNNLGNLVSRVIVMAEKYFEGKAPKNEGKDHGFKELTENLEKFYAENVEKFDLKLILEKIIEYLDYANKYVDNEKPWELKKTDENKLKQVIYNLLEALNKAALFLYPVMPATSVKIVNSLGFKEFQWDFKGLKWGLMKEGQEVKRGEALFPVVEE